MFTKLESGGRDKQEHSLLSAKNFELLGGRGQRALSAYSTAPIPARPVQRVSENTPHVRKPIADIAQQVTLNQGWRIPSLYNCAKVPPLWKTGNSTFTDHGYIHALLPIFLMINAVLNVWLGTSVILIHLCWRLLGGFDLRLTFRLDLPFPQWEPFSRKQTWERKGLIETMWMV